MNITRTIAALVTGAAIVLSATMIPRIPEYYEYLTVIRPHKKLIERFESVRTKQEYNLALEEFVTGSKLKKYFAEATPIEAYEFFRIKTTPCTQLDQQLSNPIANQSFSDASKGYQNLACDYFSQSPMELLCAIRDNRKQIN